MEDTSEEPQLLEPFEVDALELEVKRRLGNELGIAPVKICKEKK